MDNLNLYTKISALPESIKEEVLRFMDSLKKKESPKMHKKPKGYGILKGKMKIHLDFDEPLKDFDKYQ